MPSSTQEVRQDALDDGDQRIEANEPRVKLVGASEMVMMLISVVTAGVPRAVVAQPPGASSALLARPEVVKALDRVGRSEPRAVGTLITLASIVSPSGREQARAAAVARVMRQIGLTKVEVDSVPNVIGVIPGTSGKALVFVTMLDDLPIIETFQRRAGPVRQGDRVVGPATELQSTVAAMLTAAEALAWARIRPHHDLVFTAVAREETGLQGMEALYAELGTRAVGFVEVMGDGHEIFYGAGGAIAWWRAVARGPAGHTAEGGLPNVNLAIARAVDRIFALTHPERYRDRETVINVGMLRSGEVFNHKSRRAGGSPSMFGRGTGRIVEAIGREIEAILAKVSAETGIAVELVPDLVSLGGQLRGARESALTRAAVAASRQLGYEPTLSDLGCCNMRVAVINGTPAVGIHGERGGGRGTADEWASIPSMMNTARHVVLMAAEGGLRSPRSPVRALPPASIKGRRFNADAADAPDFHWIAHCRRPGRSTTTISC